MTQTRVTELLLSLRGGNREALDELVPLVYGELRTIARRKLRYERRGHTLNTTALVNEAYLKLVQLDRVEWQSRVHFLAIASQVMRNILVDYALRRRRIKRGGGIVHAPLKEAESVPVVEVDRILALDAALEKLNELNPRHARIVEYRFFGGMTIEETATALEISDTTVKRDWALLRLWLGRELEREV
jgi:RNA polymerase sigma factor (TIGR02999 family)